MRRALMCHVLEHYQIEPEQKIDLANSILVIYKLAKVGY